MKEWYYTQRRVMDKDGNIDEAVMKDMKEMYGETMLRITKTGMFAGSSQYNFDLSQMMGIGAVLVVVLAVMFIEPACCGGAKHVPAKERKNE